MRARPPKREFLKAKRLMWRIWNPAPATATSSPLCLTTVHVNILAQTQVKRPGQWVSDNHHLLRPASCGLDCCFKWETFLPPLFQRYQTLKMPKSLKTRSAIRANGTFQTVKETQKTTIYAASNILTPTFAQILRKVFHQIVILRLPSER